LIFVAVSAYPCPLILIILITTLVLSYTVHYINTCVLGKQAKNKMNWEPKPVNYP
jgi:hypothetical protein